MCFFGLYIFCTFCVERQRAWNLDGDTITCGMGLRDWRWIEQIFSFIFSSVDLGFFSVGEEQQDKNRFLKMWRPFPSIRLFSTWIKSFGSTSIFNVKSHPLTILIRHPLSALFVSFSKHPPHMFSPLYVTLPKFGQSLMYFSLILKIRPIHNSIPLQSWFSFRERFSFICTTDEIERNVSAFWKLFSNPIWWKSLFCR